MDQTDSGVRVLVVNVDSNFLDIITDNTLSDEVKTALVENAVIDAEARDAAAAEAKEAAEMAAEDAANELLLEIEAEKEQESKKKAKNAAKKAAKKAKKKAKKKKQTSTTVEPEERSVCVEEESTHTALTVVEEAVTGTAEKEELVSADVSAESTTLDDDSFTQELERLCLEADAASETTARGCLSVGLNGCRCNCNEVCRRWRYGVGCTRSSCCYLHSTDPNHRRSIDEVECRPCEHGRYGFRCAYSKAAELCGERGVEMANAFPNSVPKDRYTADGWEMRCMMCSNRATSLGHVLAAGKSGKTTDGFIPTCRECEKEIGGDSLFHAVRSAGPDSPLFICRDELLDKLLFHTAIMNKVRETQPSAIGLLSREAWTNFHDVFWNQ